MARYIALLRAVNVGGTGKLLMSDLAGLCRDAGFARVETYIASGNVVFESRAAVSRIKTELETRLQARARRPVGVVVRTASEMQAVLDANPFPNADPRRIYVLFLDSPPPPDTLSRTS